MTTANEPAFPIDSNELQSVKLGLSKREYFAAKAMSGLLACDYVGNTGQPPNSIAESAIHYADALIELLDKTKQP